jgi:6-phosphofructokinase 2
MNKKYIVTLTINPAIDKSTSIDRVVAEHKMRCKNPVYEPGGGGINVSRAIKKLGRDSIAVCTAGGHTGRLLEALLLKEEIRHRLIPVVEWTRESLAVFEEATGLQYRFNMEGPVLRDTEWEETIKTVRQEEPTPDYIVGSGLLPPGVPQDFYARLSQTGRDLGARVIIDTSGEPLRLALQGHPFMIKPNLRELSMIAGRELQGTTEQSRVAMEIVANGQCDVVVVSLGEEGQSISNSDRRAAIKSPESASAKQGGCGGQHGGRHRCRSRIRQDNNRCRALWHGGRNGRGDDCGI